MRPRCHARRRLRHQRAACDRSCGSRRFGFTLIELIAVTAILALVAASVALSARPTIAAARLESAALRLESIDHLLRESATRQRASCRLTIEPSTGRLVRLQGNDRIVLDQGLPIARVIGSEGELAGQAIALTYRSDGSSPTCCIELATGGLRRWTWICGGTGQITHFEKEADVAPLLGRLRSL